MEKIQPQSLLDSGLPEIEPPVVLPCVLEIVQKIENYSETSNLGNRVNSVKDSMKDVSSAGLTKEKKFPRIARPAEQESSGDKGEQEIKGGGKIEPKRNNNGEIKGGGKIEPKRNNNGDNLSKLPSKAKADSASVKINNETLSKNQAEGRESNDDVFRPVANKYSRGNMTPSCRSKSQLSKAREFKNSKEMTYSSSSTKRKYRSRNHLLREKRNLMYKSILRKYYSSLKKYVKKFIDKTRVSTIHRSHQVAMLIRKDPQHKVVPPLKEGELIMRNVATRSASRRMRRKRNLQVDDDDFSDESSGVDKTTWRSYRTPKRRNHFTNCGKRQRQRMKRHTRPVRIDASSSDETPVAKTSSEEASVHAHAPAIVESVNDIGYIREHRSGAEVLPAPETIIKNLEEFVHGKKRKKSAPRVYLFGVPKRHRKARNIQYYSDADSLLSLSDEDIFSKEVKGRKKYYMKHVKSHSRSVFKMPGTLIRKIKKMWKLEQNQQLYCEDEQECETSDVIIIRQPKYKIRNIPRHFMCKDCEMRSRGALLKDPFVYNVTNTAGVFSEEKIESKRNEVDDKEVSGTSVIGTSCTNNRHLTLDENILHKLIGYNGFEYHCLSCKCDDCKVSKIPANFRSSRSKTGKGESGHPRNHWKSQADLENQTSRQCCRCAGRDQGEGRVGRKFIFYERDFSQMPPPKENPPLAAANRVDNCPSSSTPVETRDGSCPIKGGTDDVLFCKERKISNGCIAREKGLKNSEVKVNRGFRAGIKRNNRVNSRKKGR